MIGEDCKICRLIRVYLYVAVPLLILVASGSGSGSASQSVSIWFASVRLIDVLAYGSLATLVFIIAYKWIIEFYLPSKQKNKLAALSEKFSVTDDVE